MALLCLGDRKTRSFVRFKDLVDGILIQTVAVLREGYRTRPRTFHVEARDVQAEVTV